MHEHLNVYSSIIILKSKMSVLCLQYLDDCGSIEITELSAAKPPVTSVWYHTTHSNYEKIILTGFSSESV